MRWIAIACCASVLAACSQTPPPAQPAVSPAPSVAPPQAKSVPPVDNSPVVQPAPAPTAPAAPQSPYQDVLAQARNLVNQPYAAFQQYATTNQWQAIKNSKCEQNLKTSAQWCKDFPELMSCPSLLCNATWVRKDGASVVVQMNAAQGNISSAPITRFTFFGLSEKNEEIPSFDDRVQQELKARAPQPQP